MANSQYALQTSAKIISTRALELSIKSIVENPRVILTKEQQQDSANFSLPLINDQFVIRTFGHK